MDWGKWFRDNYDKHLLLILFVGCLAFAIYTQNVHMDEGAMDWARSKADQVLGGLMTLIAGKLVANHVNRSADPPTDTTPPTAPPDSGRDK